MSQENVETVRRWYEALDREGPRGSGTRYWDGDADYYPVRKFPEARPCHGREAATAFLEQALDAWTDLTWRVEEVIAVSDDRVLARATMRGEGRESGMKLEGDVYRCFWLRHGMFFRVEDHLTLKGALHGLGLQGETLAAAGLAE